MVDLILYSVQEVGRLLQHSTYAQIINICRNNCIKDSYLPRNAVALTHKWDVVVVESCRSKKWLWRSLVQLGKFSRLAVQSNIDTQLLGGGVGDRILKFAVFGLLALSLVCRGVPDERTTFVTDNPAGHGICRRTLIPDIPIPECPPSCWI